MWDDGKTNCYLYGTNDLLKQDRSIETSDTFYTFTFIAGEEDSSVKTVSSIAAIMVASVMYYL